MNPRCGHNLNRWFPGNPTGMPSAQVAAFLLAAPILGSDAYVDAHRGDMNEAIVPFALWANASDARVRETSHGMATPYGLERTMAADPDMSAEMAVGTAVLRGVPAIIAEVGQHGVCDETLIELHRRGLQNVMAHLGMIPPIGPAAPVPQELAAALWLRTDTSAIYHPPVKVGDPLLGVGVMPTRAAAARRVTRAPSSPV